MEETKTVRSPAAVIIFTIITCGIYGLVWTYHYAWELKNYLKREDLSPGVELLLCIICFPYLLYWSYKYGKALYEAQLKAGISATDDSILYLILSLLGLHIITMAVMQSNINRVWQEKKL